MLSKNFWHFKIFIGSEAPKKKNLKEIPSVIEKDHFEIGSAVLGQGVRERERGRGREIK